MPPDPEFPVAGQVSGSPRRPQGKLRVFLGYAAGVGKTYAMLEAARRRKQEGRDPLIACVDTHGRPETANLLAGLKVLPPPSAESGIDVDSILARRPPLVVIDDLARANSPSARRPKRYQEVEDLLEHGIDVYTTLNIAQVESLRVTVEEITGRAAGNTVPDRILQEAEEIRLIDIHPNELLERLKQGKVNVADHGGSGVRRFLRPDELLALRELAFHYTARRVREQIAARLQSDSLPATQLPRECVLVCVGLSDSNARLLQVGHQMAKGLEAELAAIYVETRPFAGLSEPDKHRLSETLRLASELGATVITVRGRSVVEEVLRYSRAHHVVRIVVGRSRGFTLAAALRRSVSDQMVRRSEEAQVYVIDPSSPASGGVRRQPRRARPNWESYALSLGLILLVTIFGWWIREILRPANLQVLYLLAVVVSALRWGRRAAIFSAAVGTFVFDFVFVPPQLSFAITDVQFLVTLTGLLAVALVTGTLAGRVREQIEAARNREAYSASLYSLSRSLATTRSLDRILEVIAYHIGETFERPVVILLPADGRLSAMFESPDFPFPQEERAAAEWVFQHGRQAGPGTGMFTESTIRYLPLTTSRGVVGVLGVKAAGSGERWLSAEQHRLLEAFASQAALASERALLEEKARHAQLLEQTDKLQKSLLNSISHDLRTPLASITGALSSLSEDSAVLDEATRRELLDTAQEEARRLNRLVGNLLDMTRLEAGAMRVKIEPCDVQDVIGAALAQLGEGARKRKIVVETQPDLPLVPMDFVLITQTLVNLLDNALKYSPAGEPVCLQVRAAEQDLEILVADRGIGIPPGEVERIFERFRRQSRSAARQGAGLGLSICKGFVEAHGGRIWAERRPEGGSIFGFTLPRCARKAPAVEMANEPAEVASSGH